MPKPNTSHLTTPPGQAPGVAVGAHADDPPDFEKVRKTIRIRKVGTCHGTPRKSKLIKSLLGVDAPPVNVDRPLGGSEKRQTLIHLGNSDLLGAAHAKVGTPVSVRVPQLGCTVETFIAAQFRFTKKMRKEKVFGEIMRNHDRIRLNELDDGSLVLYFY